MELEGEGVGRRSTKRRTVTAYLDPFPMRLKAKLKYAGICTFNAAAGAVASYSFAANGMYDPDITGTGHQPMYYDQLMAVYARASVTGATIKVTPIGTQTAPEGTILGVFLDNDTTTGTTLIECVERPGSKYISVGSWENQNKGLVFRYDAVKYHGKGVVSEHEHESSATGNPANVDYFKLFNGAPSTTVNPGDVNCLVEIWYDAIFHDRIETGQS